MCVSEQDLKAAKLEQEALDLNLAQVIHKVQMDEEQLRGAWDEGDRANILCAKQMLRDDEANRQAEVSERGCSWVVRPPPRHRYGAEAFRAVPRLRVAVTGQPSQSRTQMQCTYVCIYVYACTGTICLSVTHSTP